MMGVTLVAMAEKPSKKFKRMLLGFFEVTGGDVPPKFKTDGINSFVAVVLTLNIFLFRKFLWEVTF